MSGNDIYEIAFYVLIGIGALVGALIVADLFEDDIDEIDSHEDYWK